jgi:hypothetical protein
MKLKNYILSNLKNYLKTNGSYYRSACAGNAAATESYNFLTLKILRKLRLTLIKKHILRLSNSVLSDLEHYYVLNNFITLLSPCNLVPDE